MTLENTGDAPTAPDVPIEQTPATKPVRDKPVPTKCNYIFGTRKTQFALQELKFRTPHLLLLLSEPRKPRLSNMSKPSQLLPSAILTLDILNTRMLLRGRRSRELSLLTHHDTTLCSIQTTQANMPCQCQYLRASTPSNTRS